MQTLIPAPSDPILLTLYRSLGNYIYSTSLALETDINNAVNTIFYFNQNVKNAVINKVNAWGGTLFDKIAFESGRTFTRLLNSETRLSTLITGSQAIIIDRIRSNRIRITDEILLSEARIGNGVKNQFMLLKEYEQTQFNAILTRIADAVLNINTNAVANRNYIVSTQTARFDRLETLIMAINGGVSSDLAGQFQAVREDIGRSTASILGSIALQTAAQAIAIGAQTAELNAAIAASTATIIAAMGVGELIDTGAMIAAIPLITAGIVALANYVIPQLKTVTNKLLTNQYTSYADFWADFDKIGGTGSISKFLLDIVRLPAVLIGGILATTKPYIENLETLARNDANSTLLSPPQLFSIWHRLRKDREVVAKDLRKLGYKDSDVDELLADSFTYPNPDLLRIAFTREKINETTHDDLLRRAGFTDQHIEIAKRLYHTIPPYQDIVRLFVKEVFTPEIAERFGQFQEFPTEFTTYIRQLGLEDKWARLLWAGHWDLPSATQGFDMLHRGIINRDELKDLLKALDVMPYWRDKLINLTFSVPRLVDIRRWFEDHVIDESQVFDYYQDRGYDVKEATFATQWTVNQASKGTDEERSKIRLLTQSVIVRAYQKKFITRNIAKAKLVQMRYTESDADLILDLADYKEIVDRSDEHLKDNYKRLEKIATDGYANRALSYEDSISILKKVGFNNDQAESELQLTDYEFNKRMKGHIASWYKELYVTWLIDRDTFTIAMSENSFSPEEIERMLLEFDVLRETRTKRPSQAQIETWYKNGFIDLTQYADELRGLGYNERYVTLYLQELGEIAP